MAIEERGSFAPQATANHGLPPPTTSGRRVWLRFLKHRMALLSLWILAFSYLLMVFAEFFAPYGMISEDRDRAYQPPAVIHVRDAHGRWAWPYVYNLKRSSDTRSLLVASGTTNVSLENWVEEASRAYPISLFVKGEPYKILGIFPWDRHILGVSGTRFYLFGGDADGRDVFSRLFFGARVSLTVGIVAIAIVIPIGTLVGGVAGYFGGWVDTLLMWLAETLLAFPYLYLLLALFGVTYKWDISPSERYFAITICLSLLGWASLARVIRGMVLSLKAQEYIEAAKAAGAGHFWIITRHLLPQTATWIVVSMSLAVPTYIYAESVLSLLGLGVQPPDASWGNMLEGPSRNVSDLLLHPWLLAPGLCIVLTTVAWNFFGDGLRDAFDAKRRV